MFVTRCDSHDACHRPRRGAPTADKLQKFWLCRNVWKNLNAHGGFTPAAWLPPNAITPEYGIQHYRAAQGRSGGTGNVPSFIFCAWILYSDKNEFYRAKILKNTLPAVPRRGHEAGFYRILFIFYGSWVNSNDSYRHLKTKKFIFCK